MTGAYLEQNACARTQYRRPRRATPNGLVLVHTAESVMDSVGPDTGAENVAAWMTRRTDPGSYHDLADSDTNLQLVPYDAEAFSDGTGSNPFALSIAFACRGTDWPKMSVARRDAFLMQGALAFGRQQEWLAANDYPRTPLIRITRSESARREPGFVTHGDRDPGRRSDPGMSFPFERFFQLCSYVVAQPPATPTLDEEDDVDLYRDDRPGAARPQDVIAFTPLGRRHVSTAEELGYWQASGRAPKTIRLLKDDPRLAAAVDLLPWLA